MFWENEVNSIVKRNFDNKEWVNPNDINSSLLGDKNESFNPEFVDPIKGDYHIKTTSRCKNKGTSKYCFELDTDGNSRTGSRNNESVSIDIGVDEIK